MEWKSVGHTVSLSPKILPNAFGQSPIEDLVKQGKWLQEELSFNFDLMLMTPFDQFVAKFDRGRSILMGDTGSRSARLAAMAEGTDPYFWDRFPKFEFGADMHNDPEWD